MPYQDHLILFGGGNGKDASFGDLYKFSLKTRLWTRLEPFGGFRHSPAPREAHICQTLGEFIILHGGLNQKEESFDDTWVLAGLSKRLDHPNVYQKNPLSMNFQALDNDKHSGNTNSNAVSGSDQPPLYQLYGYRGRRQAAMIDKELAE